MAQPLNLVSAPPVASSMTTEMPAFALAAATRKLARTILAGFNRHYELFRACAVEAKAAFEHRSWLALQHLSEQRIDFYTQRVTETVTRVEQEFSLNALDDEAWQRVKLEYIELLSDHRQPELAETFFNSVSCRILHRDYYDNKFIFVRPAISTEFLDYGFPDDPPAYRCYYPNKQGLRTTLMHIIVDFDLRSPFTDFRRDLRQLLQALRRHLPRPLVLEADHQIRVLGSLFFRNKAAYIVGKMVNGATEQPFVVPLRYDNGGKLYIDALLWQQEDIDLLFSSFRAYFLVDMPIPSAYVSFLETMLPLRPRAEIYTVLGLQKQGKTLFYRDFLHHLRHSSDSFTIAPGIKGLVMLVFTLPSYPYVFKLIRDKIAPPKDTTRALVAEKYHLVKHHDRMGRMADSLEYSDVAFPRARFEPQLIAELKASAPSMVEDDGITLVIKHLYIERRMIPLNLYIETATAEEREQAIGEYGNALKQLAAVNIFAGDLLFKNFGVTRYNRVVFYDYDELDYLTRCRFRRIPQAPPGFDEMAAEVWYPVGPTDVFPEEFATFLLTDPSVRELFVAQHANLLDVQWWIDMQQRLLAGHIEDEISYRESARFKD